MKQCSVSKIVLIASYLIAGQAFDLSWQEMVARASGAIVDLAHFSLFAGFAINGSANVDRGSARVRSLWQVEKQDAENQIDG